MSAWWLLPTFLVGIFAPFAFLSLVNEVETWLDERKRQKWKRDNHGRWHIHSHAGSGSDYSNGGRYTIYRVGYTCLERDDWREWTRWHPPMRTEAEALAECARLNAPARLPQEDGG